MSTTYANQLISLLEKQGVQRIYGLVGDSLNPFVDAVRNSSIEWVHVHNEESAAFAAGADSLVTGELAVCAASCGPGNTHLIQGLYDAHRNGAKVLAIASHIPSEEIGSNFFQETHPEKLFAECSGYCEMANSASQGARIAHHAVQSTLAGEGVSVLVVPGDVFTAEADQEAVGSSLSEISTGKPVLHPDPREAAGLAQAINEADKVTLFVGAGARDAREQVLALAEKIGAPIGHSLGGKMYIQYDNPFDVGMSGLLGYGAAHEAMHEADLLVLLGTDFPYTDFLPTANVAQVDVKQGNIGRRTRVSHPVAGDVAATLDAIADQVEPKGREFLDTMLELHAKKVSEVIEAYTHDVEDHKPIHPEYVANILDEEAAEDAIFTVDTGMGNVWGARYITPNGRREQLGSFRHGTMANALPQAIGAQAAQPDRQVVTFSGDGGLAMLLGELLTVAQHQLPVKAFVFNNASLGMVKLEMLVEGMPDFGTDHAQINFAEIARAAGITTFRIEDPAQARQIIRQALDHPGPVLVDIVTDPDALSIPPDLTVEQLAGFSKAATRTVLSGGVSKMWGLAMANLRNIPKP